MKKISFIVLIIIIFSLTSCTYARYIINKTISITSSSQAFHFNVEPNSTYIEQKNNEANLTLNINNYISDTNYNKTNTKYSIMVTSSKYSITITDSNNETLTGGQKKTNSINIKFVPKDSTSLNLEEQATITVTTSSPYKKTITKTITIKNSDILYNVGVVSGGYSTNIDSTGIVGWKNLTAENFFLDVTKVEVPGEAIGTMNFSKVYNATTGLLTLNRTSITGAGFIIQFTANIYASFQPVLVGNVTGGYSITIDCTGVTDWQSRTANDFIMDIIWIDLPSEITGTMYFTKSYNPSTGKLTINRSSIIGNGTVTFNANIYTTRYPSQITSLSKTSNIVVTSTDNKESYLLNNNSNIKNNIENNNNNDISLIENTIINNDALDSSIDSTIENTITTSSTIELIENITS